MCLYPRYNRFIMVGSTIPQGVNIFKTSKSMLLNVAVEELYKLWAGQPIADLRAGTEHDNGSLILMSWIYILTRVRWNVKSEKWWNMWGGVRGWLAVGIPKQRPNHGLARRVLKMLGFTPSPWQESALSRCSWFYAMKYGIYLCNF